jgi:glutamyl-tRNA synthetase
MEETDRKRSEAKAQNIPYKYDRASSGLNKEQIEKNIAEGKEYSVRFRVPEGDTVFEDIVHGETSFRNSEIDDFVILRSDGSPIYQLAVVVDDHDMAITHVIRGDDHLSNTPKQIMLYNALGWEVPQFAHLPMILDEEKKKLSKRRNTVSVEEYKEQGFLSDALFNFLTLLGFAPEDNREILSKRELVNEFTFERVNKKPAVFDMNKLSWINFQYIKNTEDIVVAQMVKEKLLQTGRLTPDAITALGEEYLISIVQIMKERVTTINDFIDKGIYFFTEPAEYDEKGLAKHWNAEIKKSFTEYAAALEKLAEWNAEDLESHLREFTESKGLKAGQIIHPLRLALTGQTTSPGIFEVMVLLGKEQTIARVNRFINFSAN